MPRQLNTSNKPTNSSLFDLGFLMLFFFSVAQAGILWPILIACGFSVAFTSLISVATIVGYIFVYQQKTLKSNAIGPNKFHYKIKRSIILATRELDISFDQTPYELSGKAIDSWKVQTVFTIWGLIINKELLKMYQKDPSQKLDSVEDYQEYLKSSIELNTLGEDFKEWFHFLLNNKSILNNMFSYYSKRLNDNYDAQHTLEALVKENQFFNKLSNHDNIDPELNQKLNAKIKYYVKMNELKLFPVKDVQKNLDDIADTIGYANILIGNSISGLYGAVVGFSSIFMLIPNIVMSPAITFMIAGLGGVSAGYAAYVMTLPFLKKCLEYFHRAHRLFLIEVESEGFGNALLQYVTFRNVLTFLCWTLVMIAAVKFNMMLAWRLPHELAIIFSGTYLGTIFANCPLVVKIVLTGLQGVITFFCGGAIYMISCFNQYIGRNDKKPIRTITVFDKIVDSLSEASLSTTLILIFALTLSILCSYGQVIIWLVGLPFALQCALVVPATSIYFAMFCESALNCLSPKAQTPIQLHPLKSDDMIRIKDESENDVEERANTSNDNSVENYTLFCNSQ
jgi:hypothetical protein